LQNKFENHLQWRVVASPTPTNGFVGWVGTSLAPGIASLYMEPAAETWINFRFEVENAKRLPKFGLGPPPPPTRPAPPRPYSPHAAGLSSPHEPARLLPTASSGGSTATGPSGISSRGPMAAALAAPPPRRPPPVDRRGSRRRLLPQTYGCGPQQRLPPRGMFLNFFPFFFPFQCTHTLAHTHTHTEVVHQPHFKQVQISFHVPV
jgi:hypothetical protein